MSDHALAWANLLVQIVGSVATLAALVVAIVIGVREARAFRAENVIRDTERTEELTRRRREQAECVSARLHVEPQPARYVAGAEVIHPDDAARTNWYWSWAEVINASALPVYDVEVELRRSDLPDHSALVPKDFVPGGQTGHVHTGYQPNKDLHDASLGILFRDAAGRRWHRHADGDLHERDLSA